MIRARCPDPSDWQALLEHGGAGDEPDSLVRHLETCPDCRQTLETLAADAAVWQDAQALSGRRAEPEAALRQVVERLKGELPLAADEEDLSFLRPADRPGLLGMLGPYEVRGVIGRGGMGLVLQAFEPALQRLVAVKVLAAALAGSATARLRFKRETYAAAAVTHDHIVPVYAVHEADGLPYLVMQYVAGESLQARLDRDGPLPAEEAVRIGWQTASGLAAAHAQGLIHRDIKPANLLLENGVARVKITDFGLARMADDAGLTRDGVVAGTPEYMAPEQARGEPVDHRADLYALGAVLYACCTGRPPFRGSTALAVLRRVSDEEPTPIRSLNPAVPAWLEGLVARLLAKAPAERFQTAAEVAGLLEAYLAHLRQPTTIPAPELPLLRVEGRSKVAGHAPEKASARWLRRGLGLAALALAAVVGVAGAFWLAGAVSPTPELQIYEQSFEGTAGCPPEFELFGPGADEAVQFQKDGLRITLPAGSQRNPGGTGLRSRFGVKGDFEITVNFDILAESPPAEPGKQTRFGLEVPLDRPGFNTATLSRRTQGQGTTEFFAWLTCGGEQAASNREQSKVLSTVARQGRLRITRNGPTLTCYTSEGHDGTFALLRKFRYGDEDLKDVRVLGATDGAQGSLDVLVRDLHVRAQGLPNLPETLAAVPGSAVINGRGAFTAAAIIAFLAALGLVGGWLLLRRGRRARPAPAPGSAAKSAPAAPLISFPCPRCGHALRVKAESAGKKGKCPRCGEPVLVPQAGTGAPAPAGKGSRSLPLKALGFALGLPLLAVLLFVGGWRLWHRGPSPAPPQPTSFIGVSLGGEPAQGVEESGFSYQEYDNGREPFRWTTGDGKLVIPIDRAAPPQAVAVYLHAYRRPGETKASLQVLANGKELFNEGIHLGGWEKTFDLRGIDLGDRLVLELKSDTFDPVGTPGINGKNLSDDNRTLGVQVQSVRLLARAVEVRELATSDRTVAIREEHPVGLRGAALTTDGKTLVTGGRDGSIALWDVAAGRKRAYLPNLAPGLFALAVSPDGATFATVTPDGAVRIWDAATGRRTAERRGYFGQVLTLAYAPDGRTLALAGVARSGGGELRFWDVAAGSERGAAVPLKFQPRALAFAPDGKSVAVAGASWTAEVIDTGSGNTRASIEYRSYARGITFSPDGQRLAVSYGNAGVVRICDLEGGREWCRVQAPRGNDAGRLEFTPDGRRLLVTGFRGSALVWDVSDPQAPALTTLAGHEGPVRFAGFLPDGRTVVTAEDGAIRLWSLGDPAPLPQAAGPEPAPTTGRPGGWAVAGIVALALALALVACFFLRRRWVERRPAGAAPGAGKAGRATAPAKDAAVPAPAPASQPGGGYSSSKGEAPHAGRDPGGPPH